tara:strand:+ start:16521 stop:17069 length:549 start_codon:yes stop_codon:yes gene_type:complete
MIKLKDLLDEKCWKGYEKKGMKTMFGKRYPNCVKKKRKTKKRRKTKKEEIEQQEPDTLFKQGPGMDVRKENNIEDTWPNDLDEDLRAWFGKGGGGSSSGGGWDRYNTKGERIGKCGDRKKGEGKPKCLSKRDARRMSKKDRAAAVRKKRREDGDKNRSGKAKNVSSKTRKNKRKSKRKSKKG